MSSPKVLEDAVEKLYAVFSSYPLSDNTMPCSCCHAPHANALLHAKPLRELEWEHLQEYGGDALMIWGGVAEFKHLLPRLLDLVLNAGDWSRDTTNPETVFGHFQRAKWRTWPHDEQRAVENLLHAVWDTVRSNPPIDGGYIDVDQWLCCISQCETDLGPYLDRWMQDQRLSASWALSSLVLGSTIAYTGPDHTRPVWGDDPESIAKISEWYKLPHRGAYWERCSTQYDQLQKWVRSPATLEKLRRAEVECDNSEMEREFATAQRCILEARSTKWEPVYRHRLFQTAFWESPTYRLY
jgi:hypothetical protein